MAQRLQDCFDRLVGAFIKPLLLGQVVEVGQALAPHAVDYFQSAVASEAQDDLEVVFALNRRAAQVAPSGPIAWPDRNLLSLAMAAHNLVLLTDPTLGRWISRNARRTILGWVDALIESVPVPKTREDALFRHALLEHLPDLSRKDIVVRNWAYTYRYYGRAVPPNVVAFPRLRRVRQSERRVLLDELLEGLDERADLGLSKRYRALMSRSPVSELMRAGRDAMFRSGLRFGYAALSVLSDPAIRGGVARDIAQRGEWVAADALGGALGDPSLSGASPAMLYYALMLPFETAATSALDVSPAPLPSDVLEREAVGRYASVLPVLLSEPGWAAERLAFGPRDQALLDDRAVQLRTMLPRATMSSVQQLAQRAAPPRARSRPEEMPS